MTYALFCDECGAALPAQGSSCAVCGQYFGTTLPRPQVQVVQTPLSPSMPVPAGALGPGSLLAQRYAIICQVGQGGFGAVYKAKDCFEKNKLVAIKQISLNGLSPQKMIEATDTYNRELMYLSQLKHENLPRVYDHFTDPEHWYVVMEYIEGKTLEDILKTVRGGHFSVKRVLNIGIMMCSVLGYLHAQHPPIIYRDVKPANILFTPEGHLSLIDFGIARLYRPGQAKDTGQLGSPGYAAPEQYGRAQTTAQSDIYSLGATLQTLLTGKEPLEILVGGEPTDCIKPKALHTLLIRMLEPDPSKRPQSMDEVKQILLELKEHSVEQKVKRMLAFTGSFLARSGLWVIPLLVLMFIIFLIFVLNGFFSSPFWIASLPLMLFTIVGRSVHYLHHEIDVTSTRLNAKNALAVVLRHLEGSISYALIPAILFFLIYYIQQLGISDGSDQSVSLAFLGGVVLVFILGGLYFLREEFAWLLHLVSSRLSVRKHKQVPPLQQHMHKRS
jgi:serine/threonine protein kinase